MYLASQIIVILGLIIDLTGKVLKSKKYILLFIAIASILYTLSYVLLQSPLSAIANFIAMIRTFLYLFYDKNNKKYVWYLITIILQNVVFVTCAIVFWNNALDIFLIVSTLILSIGLSFKSANFVRVTLMINSVFWMIYNLSLKGYMNFACDVISFSLVLGALIFYTCKDKKQLKEKETMIEEKGIEEKQETLQQ